MIKRRHTNHYERKMWSNKVEYSNAAGVYFTTRDVKVPFFMLELSRSKIINHHFHFDLNKGDSGIGCDMIIGCDLVVHIGLTADFKRQVLQWGGATVNMKEPSILIGQYDLTKCKMCEVVMQAVEPDSTCEATERILKILHSNYAKSDLKQLADNESHLNAEERILLLNLI